MNLHQTLRTRSAVVAGSVAAALLAAAGCSGGGSSAPKPSGAKKATGTPITVGFVNTDQGGFAIPEMTKSAQAATDYVNNNGGINGHVLKLETCATDGTPAASTKCANQFIADKVSVVLNGNDLGMDAAQPIYSKAGLHIFGAVATPAVTADPANSVLAPPYPNIFAGIGQQLKNTGATKVVFVLQNFGPIVKQTYLAFAASAKSAGVDPSLSLVAPANPDVTAAVTAAQAKKADALYFVFQENDCTNAVRTAKSLGWQGTIHAGACTQFIQKLGAQAAGVYTEAHLFPYIARKAAAAYDPQLKSDFDTFAAAMNAAGQQDILTSSFATYGFATVMTFVNIARGISGDPTQANLDAAIAAFKGHEFLGLPQDCTSKLAPGGACGRYYLNLKTQSDGTETLVQDKPLDLSTTH